MRVVPCSFVVLFLTICAPAAAQTFPGVPDRVWLADRPATAAAIAVTPKPTSPPAARQTASDDRGTTFELKAGLNRSSLTGRDADEGVEELGSKTGVVGGVAVDVPFGPSLSIQPEALVVWKGARATGESFGETASLTYSLNYLEIPVLLKWTRDRPASVSPFVFGGPAVAIQLSAKAKLSADGDEDEEDIEDVKTTDLGIVVGGGVRFGRLSAEARYTRGLMTIDAGNDPGEVRNSSVAVLVSVSFGSR